MKYFFKMQLFNPLMGDEILETGYRLNFFPRGHSPEARKVPSGQIFQLRPSLSDVLVTTIYHF